MNKTMIDALAEHVKHQSAQVAAIITVLIESKVTTNKDISDLIKTFSIEFDRMVDDDD